MKFKFALSLLLAGASLSAMAQTHVEGVEYYKADQLVNAQQLLERNMNNAGTDKGVANYYLGMIALRSNNPTKAKDYFNAGIAANPESPYNYVGLGQLALASGDEKGAETEFKKASKLAKKDAAVEVAIARAYYEALNDKGVKYAKLVEKHLDKARKINMLEPDIFIFEGDRYYNADDGNNAGAKYEMATTYNPQSADAYVKYANLFRTINPDYSIRMLKTLLTNNPTSALGQRELAKIYYDQKQFAEATEQYGKYVQNPNHFKEDEDMYALMLFFARDYQKGYDYASKLLSENPENFTARLYQLRNGSNIEALKDQWGPMASQIWNMHKSDNAKYGMAPIDFTLVAQEFIANGNTDEAREVLNEAMTKIPNDNTYDMLMAKTYSDNKDYATAAEWIEKGTLKDTTPDAYNLTRAAMYYYYGAALDRETKDAATVENLFNKGIEMANKAIAADANNYWPYKVRGDIKIQMADNKEIMNVAVEDYTKAIQLLEQAGQTEKFSNDYEQMKKYLGK